MKILTYVFGEFATNCYLVIDENSKRACLIDPAIYGAEIENTIITGGIALEFIILTHGHFDHILGAQMYREKTGAKIIIHETELEYPQDLLKNFALLYDREQIIVDKYINENDELIFGDISLRVIHTPGHTRGSCCFVCKDENVMFTGDTLFNGSIGRCNLYGGDYDTMLLSLQKLKSFVQNYTIYPGHGDATTLDNEKVNNPYLSEI